MCGASCPHPPTHESGQACDHCDSEMGRSNATPTNSRPTLQGDSQPLLWPLRASHRVGSAAALRHVADWSQPLTSDPADCPPDSWERIINCWLKALGFRVACFTAINIQVRPLNSNIQNQIYYLSCQKRNVLPPIVLELPVSSFRSPRQFVYTYFEALCCVLYYSNFFPGVFLLLMLEVPLSGRPDPQAKQGRWSP